MALVITSGCHWSYSTSVFFGRPALVEYDQWHPNMASSATRRGLSVSIRVRRRIPADLPPKQRKGWLRSLATGAAEPQEVVAPYAPRRGSIDPRPLVAARPRLQATADTPPKRRGTAEIRWRTRHDRPRERDRRRRGREGPAAQCRLERFSVALPTAKENGDWLPALEWTAIPVKGRSGRVSVPFFRTQRKR